MVKMNTNDVQCCDFFFHLEVYHDYPLQLQCHMFFELYNCMHGLESQHRLYIACVQVFHAFVVATGCMHGTKKVTP